MKKKQCSINLICLVLLLLLVGAGAYVYYIMIYAKAHEPGTNVSVTSTDAVLYDLEEQIAILKDFDEMYKAMETNAPELNRGTVVIPGLEATRTLQDNNDGQISICTSMTPQGLCVAEEYILVSAYCYTHMHNSVVYMIDKNSGEFVKEIVLKDKNHVGGLAYDTVNHMIWVTSGHGGRAAVSAFSLHNLKNYDLEREKLPIAYTYSYDLYTLEKDSFMTYSEGYLYIGHFSMEKNSVVQSFKIGEDGGLKTESGAVLGVNKEIALPEEVKQIPNRIQGIAIYGDRVILTQSYGWTPSRLLVYDNSDFMHQTEGKYTINRLSMPQKLEQIYIDGNDLYVLFESAAYAYRAQPLPKVDRICKLNLSDIIETEVEDIKTKEADVKKEKEPMERIQDMTPGTKISKERLKMEDISSLFYAEPISDEIFARMYGKSYKTDCTVPREELRYVRVLHVGFDGETYIGELVVNKIIAEKTVSIFRELYEISYPIEKIRLIDDYDADDGASMADNNASAFNFRFISYSKNLSNHAKGLAIDINPLYNPYVKMVDDWLSIEPENGVDYVDRTKDFPYKIDHEDPCYKIFASHGFSWGGDWTNRKDYQHFEYIVEE